LTERYEVAVVGSGFAGSLLAMVARRIGLSVVLLEKGTHPRVVIGESSTPLSNLLLEELSTRYDLSALLPLTKWGTWRRSYPNTPVGLKRGFTFHHHVLGAATKADSDRRDQLLVAASPHDEIGDTHWYRADFDHMLVREAQKLGVIYVDRVQLGQFEENAQAAILRGMREGREVEFIAEFVVDATGPRGFLHQMLGLRETDIPGIPPTQALYSHFSGAGRLNDTPFDRTAGGVPPYPIDDAAVHHIFDGGWMWVLQFNNGITSAGVAMTDACASRFQLREGKPAWDRLLAQIPAIREQFSTAQAELPFTYIPRLSFRTANPAGNRQALLPSAAGFVDPLLSTGFPLTLLGVARLANILESHWGTPDFTMRLAEYAQQTESELLAAGRLIAALYANMSNFPVFAALTFLYFAAASYSETARRLGKVHLARSFLLCDHPEWGPAIRRLTDRACRPLTPAESQSLIDEINEAVEPFNIAGLGRTERRNWYPVEAQDLFDAAGKVEATRSEIESMLRRCGFTPDGKPAPV
jgi:FADH2 O2-dependent halogenase